MNTYYDLNDWELFSDRHHSRVYTSKDGKWILKLFDTKFGESIEDLEREQRVARDVATLGIQTPAVGDLVETEFGYGLIYEKIPNKVSVARAIGKDPARLDEYVRRYSSIVKKLHETECDRSSFPSVKDTYARFIESSVLLADEDKPDVIRALRLLPDQTTCIHGDLHTGNVILSGDKTYIIDVGDFCYGDPLFDLGAMYYNEHFMPEEMLEKLFYCDKKTWHEMWRTFCKYYFGAETEEAFLEADRSVRLYGLFMVFIYAAHGTVTEQKKRLVQDELLPICRAMK